MNIYFKNPVQTGVIFLLFIDYLFIFKTAIYLNIFCFSIFVILSFYNYFFKYFILAEMYLYFNFSHFSIHWSSLSCIGHFYFRRSVSFSFSNILNVVL